MTPRTYRPDDDATWDEMTWQERLVHVLDNFEYKEGFNLSIGFDEDMADPDRPTWGWAWNIQWWAPDSRDDYGTGAADLKSLGTKIQIAPWLTRRSTTEYMVLLEIRKAIAEAESHERDEFIRYKGELPFDPH